MNGGILDDFKNTWNKPNNATVQIILINVLVFVGTGIMLIFGFGDLVRPWLGLPSNPNDLISRPWTIITYMFVHDGFFHILWNLLWFYWFARLIQEFLGSDKVIAIFVLGGLAGGLFYFAAFNVFDSFSHIREISNLVGASAGVTAAIVGAAVFMPNYTIYLILIGPVKIKYVALGAVFLILIGTRGNSNVGGEIAHLGGAFMGWFYISQLKKGNDIGSWVISFMNFIKSLFKPQPKIKVTHRAGNRRPSKTESTKTAGSPKNEQAEIDAILDKISQSGYESLTKDEKQKLFNASKKN